MMKFRQYQKEYNPEWECLQCAERNFFINATCRDCGHPWTDACDIIDISGLGKVESRWVDPNAPEDQQAGALAASGTATTPTGSAHMGKTRFWLSLGAFIF